MIDPTATSALTSPLASTSSPTPRETARVRETAEQFEASFLSQMLKPMFEGIKAEGPFSGGDAEDTWQSFMIDAMAKQTVKAGGIGLADQVVAQMLRMQEQGQAQ